jgi:hypothetical protein
LNYLGEQVSLSDLIIKEFTDMSETGYFPYRAHKNRPYIAEFLRLPDKDRNWNSLLQMTLARTRQAFGNRETIKADPKLNQLVHSCCMQESWFSTALADFFNGGQVVFHIAPALKEAFRHSELGDATARDLKFPFKDSYIHIGSDVGLVFNGGRTRLEGVFLSEKSHKDGKSVSMTLVGTLVKTPAHWGERGMETFTFHFGTGEMDMPLLDGAKKHLEMHGRDPTNDDKFSDLSEFDEAGKSSILESWATQAEDRRLQLENIPVVLECVRMVANALLYVSQYPDDMADDYQDGFPAGFREKIERSQGKALARNLSKVRNSGFTLIKRVGGVFECAMQMEACVDGSSDSPSPHMRRAHWRRQAFGAGLTQRKLIWIRAARVLGGTVRERPYLIADGAVSGNTEETGHPLGTI